MTNFNNNQYLRLNFWKQYEEVFINLECNGTGTLQGLILALSQIRKIKSPIQHLTSRFIARIKLLFSLLGFL